jgi:hypothetical protein
MATVNYTLPIYEAVVCNLALDKMRLDEAQEKLLAKTMELVALSKDLLKLLTERDFSVMPQDGIVQTHLALNILAFISRQSVSHLRSALPRICDKYQPALATATDQLAMLNERFEEITEAWSMAADEALVSEIKHSISSLSNDDGKEIPEWRDTLAALSD